MTRDEALELLRSGSSHDRFNAAHCLSKLANPEDLPLLLKVRHLERDAFVLKRLEAAISISSQRAIDYESDSRDTDDEDGSTVRIRAEAVEWIAGILLHEIGSKLGLVALAASLEVPSFEASKTKRHLRNLQAIFDAIEQLRSAAIAPRIEQFDLAELIDDVVAVENDGKGADISLVGMRPLLVTSSKQLLRLALCNGIRNGIEAAAIESHAEDSSHIARILVAWGATDREYWVSVVDHGPGLAGSPASSFEIGKSTKAGHPGFGLPIAKQALETLGGQVSLSPSPGGGAKYEIRWKIKK